MGGRRERERAREGERVCGRGKMRERETEREERETHTWPKMVSHSGLRSGASSDNVTVVKREIAARHMGHVP